MKLQIICLILLTISKCSFSLTSDEKILQEKENIKILESMGLPAPGSGIKIVPRTMLGLTKEEIQQGDKEMDEFKENGYVNKYINRPRELLSMTPTLINKEIQSAPIHDYQYTGLRNNITHLKLAFKFPGLSSQKSFASISPNIKMLAVAPRGGFHSEKGGWSGVSQFFMYKDIGTCVYNIMNVKASNTAAYLAQEDVSYTINNKPTILMPIEGSNNSGYIYYLKWYDENNFHELECANMKFSSRINNSIIDLAKNIDSL